MRFFVFLVALVIAGCGSAKIIPDGPAPLREPSTAEAISVHLPLWPGDAAVEVAVGHWLIGDDAPAESRQLLPGEEGTAALVLFAGWCPVSRQLLPELNRLQERLGGDAATIVGLARGDDHAAAELAERLREEAVPVAVLADDKSFDRHYLPSSGRRSIPFGAIVRDGVMLWSGPVYDRGGEMLLETVFEQVIDGSFELEEARQGASDRQNCNSALDEVGPAFEIAWKEKDLDGLKRLAPRLAAIASIEDCSKIVITAINDAAWTLVIDEAPVEGQFAAALDLAQIAMDAGGDMHGPAVDTYARTLFENGQVARAFEQEERAIDLLEKAGLPVPQEYHRALLTYAESACLLNVEGACQLSERANTREGMAAAYAGAGSPSATAEKVQPPARIRGRKAAEDFEVLVEFLSSRYAGYDDAVWCLSQGSMTLEDRAEVLSAKLVSKRSWKRDELGAALAEYLSLFEDMHLVIADSPDSEKWMTPARPIVPYFTGVVVEARGDDFVVVEEGGEDGDRGLVGKRLRGPGILPSVTRVELKTPYLFKTLAAPKPGQTTPPRYLLGHLARSAEETAPMLVEFQGAGAGTEKVSLDLHRARGARTETESELWSLKEGNPPVLTIGAFWGDVAEMPATATTLREEPVVVVDLRGNGGGSDSHVIEWFVRLSQQDFRLYEGGAQFSGHARRMSRRWSCDVDVALPTGTGGTSLMPDRVYGGKLVVLVDKNVGSSAEVFTTLASQVEGAVIVGTNTMGAITYGNVDQTITLPNSGLWIRVGRTKFVPAARPTRESYGVFPDMWLDSNDPLLLIVESYGQAARGATKE